MSTAQKRAYVIADNKIAEQAGWDRELLVVELAELTDLLPMEGLDVSLTGFEAAERSAIRLKPSNGRRTGSADH